VTPYMDFHPGGPIELMRGAGIDATQIFDEIHPWISEKSFLQNCLVGFVAQGVPSELAASGLMCNEEYRPFPLEKVTPVSPNTALYRFTLPVGSKLNHPLASHLLLRPPDRTKAAMPEATEREYTIVSPPDSVGHFDLLIKGYPKGRLSNYITQLQPGDCMECKGPFSRYTHDPARPHIGMLASGTGITPIVQVLRAVANGMLPVSQVSLLFANSQEEDVLLREELDQLGMRTEIAVHYILSRPTASWAGLSGHITSEVIAQLLPPPGPNTHILICGSIPFNRDMQDELSGLGYNNDMKFTF